MNWIFKNVIETIANVLEGTMDFLSVTVNAVFIETANLPLTNSNVKSAENVTVLIAIALVSLSIWKKWWSVYIGEAEGDSSASPLKLIEEAATAIALIVNGNMLYKILMTIAEKAGNDILTGLGEVHVEEAAEGVINITNIKDIASGMLILFVLFYVILVFVLCIKGGIRGAEICLSYILFPIFCCDLITVKKEKFGNFVWSYFTIAVGYVLQIFIFRLSGTMFVNYCSGNGIKYWMYAMAFIYMAIKTPKWLEKFVYSSGVGQTVTGAGSTVAHTIPSLVGLIK